jgi:hypothetical protein
LGYGLNIEAERRMKVAQVYADDHLIFRDDRGKLNNLVDELADSMKFAHINFNPDKWRIIEYNPNKEIEIPFSLSDEKNVQKVVRTCIINDTLKYQGVTLGIRKLIKMKFNNQRIMNVRKILDRIGFSGVMLIR